MWSELLTHAVLVSLLAAAIQNATPILLAGLGETVCELAGVYNMGLEGTMSIGDLALAERVRPQSMTQTVSDLEADGLIARCADPVDRRRILVELTGQGRQTLEDDRRQREGWLARAISEDLTAQERKVLEQAVALLRRLAED